MKRIPLLFAYLLLLFAAISSGDTIFWPVGSAGTQSSTRTLFNNFGNYHVGWDTLTTPDLCCNFHMGIDILPYNGNREVRACKEGYIYSIDVFFIPENGDSQYVAVVVDNYSTSLYGWSYQHINNPVDFDTTGTYQWNLGNLISVNDLLSEMDTLPTRNHMHLSWSPRAYSSAVGSEVNPLDSLVNAYAGIDWIWNRTFQGYPVGYDTLMCIPDWGYQSHQLWPSNIVDFNNLRLPLNSIYGNIDLLYGYCLEAIGMVGVDADAMPVNPERMKWSLYELGGPVTARFTRYVVDFSGPMGRTPEDSIRYRQHYFRLNPFSQAGLAWNGWISCITNCSDTASTWIQPGIENIQENCWESNLHQSGSGPSTIPENALYPDGPYSVEITSYAHSGDIHEYLKQIVLDNYAPSVNSVVVYQKTPYKPLYSAFWQTLQGSEFRMLTSETTGYLSDSLPCNLGVEVSFTEPMNPDTLPELWFTGEWASGAGSWSSTSLGEEYQLVPCDWDTENLGSIPDNDWSYYCFETDSGITGYHGQLRLNICGGKDLSGNSVDGDPSTVSQLRTSAVGHTEGYQEGEVDNSYLFDAACPIFSTFPCPPGILKGSYSLGSSSGQFKVILSQAYSLMHFVFSDPYYAGAGRCPWAHGFWLVGASGPSSGSNNFKVAILDFLGSGHRTFSQSTRYEIGPLPPPPSTNSSLHSDNRILSGENYGDYCWIGVTSNRSWIPDPPLNTRRNLDTQYISSKIPCEGESWLDVYCFSATGETAHYYLGSGKWYGFVEFEHNTANVNDIDVTIQVDSGVNTTVHLSPPQTDGLSLDVESVQEICAERIDVEAREFSLSFDNNPVSSSAVIRVNLADPGYTELSIHDISGRVVQRVLQSEMPAGAHNVSLPLILPSGVYFCRLTSGSLAACEKLMVIR